MKKLRNFLIAIFIFVIAIIIFFIFHVPDSAEARVKELEKSIEFYEDVEAKSRFIEYMDKYKDEEKLEIFENLSFTLLKDNRVWLVEAMNQVLPSWVESESFNAKYLLTELKLEEKRNMRLIKNLDVVKIKKKINSFDELVNEVYKQGKDNWQVEAGNFYVVDNSLEISVKYQNQNYSLEKIKLTLFEIQDAYIFDLEYADSVLTIVPSIEKYEDNGAFELEEKLKFYELERFRKYFEKNYLVQTNTCLFSLSDSVMNKPADEKNNNIIYLNLLYNKSDIRTLVDIAELRYVASMKLDFINELIGNDEQKKAKTKKQSKDLIIQKQILVNLFKDI